MSVLVATGHRPPRLGLDYSSNSNRLLTEFAVEILQELNYKNLTLISGMAQGWDQAMAHAAILLNMKLFCVLPFADFGSHWPDDAQRRRDAILRKAFRVKSLYKNYRVGGKKSYFERDIFMVNQAKDGGSVIALWDGYQNGGTFHTVKYAQESGVEVINLWDKWIGVIKEKEVSHVHNDRSMGCSTGTPKETEN